MKNFGYDDQLTHCILAKNMTGPREIGHDYLHAWS